MTGKVCGNCTLCCKLLGVKELKKPAFKWCTHCVQGLGCSIYGERPESCRLFECLWLLDPKLGPELRPDRVKLVIYPTSQLGVFAVNVDPGYRNHWKREPVYSLLKHMASLGVNVVIGWDNSCHKILLVNQGHGIVGQKTIELSAPDEFGAQHYEGVF